MKLKRIFLLIACICFMTFIVSCDSSTNDDDQNDDQNNNQSDLILTYELSGDETYYVVTGIEKIENKKLEIPNTYNNLAVKEIKSEAFKNNKKFNEVIIPSSISIMGTNVFKDTIVEKITIPYIYEGYIGYLFGGTSSSNNSSILPNTLKEVNVTNEVKVFEKAFSNANLIESITLNNNITSIERNAFYDCTSLKEVTLPNTLKEIKENAFYNCNQIQTVNFLGNIEQWSLINFENLQSTPMCFGNEIKFLIDDTLKELTNLVIPLEINTINKYQFYGFSNIQNILIHQNVNTIGEYAFVNMLNVMSFEVDENNQVFKDIDGVLYTKDEKKLINYPLAKKDTIYYTSSNTLSISEYAFVESLYLEEIVLNDGLDNIGKYAFSNASNLKKVIIVSTIKKLEDGTFYNCAKLESIYLPDELEFIGISVFEFCSNLEKIFIPKNVSTIKAYAFRNCSKLTIYCENSSAPNGWQSSYWNVYPGCPVLWNQTRD